LYEHANEANVIGQGIPYHLQTTNCYCLSKRHKKCCSSNPCKFANNTSIHLRAIWS